MAPSLDAQALESTIKKYAQSPSWEADKLEELTVFFRELRRKCACNDFRQEVSKCPTIFYYSLKLICKLIRIPFEDSGNIERALIVPHHETSSFLIDSMSSSGSSSSSLVSLTDKFINDKNPYDPGLLEQTEMSEELITLLNVVMGFFANATNSTPDSQYSFWNCGKNYLGPIMKETKPTLNEAIGAILYYVYSGCESCREEIASRDDLMTLGINALLSPKNEFWLLFFEEIFREGTNFENFYSRLHPAEKLIILELISNILQDDEIKQKKGVEEEKRLSTFIFEALLKEFNNNADLILLVCKTPKKLPDPSETMHLMRILSGACVRKEYINLIQENKSLLINCVYLLRAYHFVGLDEKSDFAPIAKVDDAIKYAKEAELDPMVGFKAEIIRLIGNLVFRNENNQNFVRENHVIDIILSCTSIDARNPFIREWSILAIRNLCENNMKNQEFIKGLKRIDGVPV